jgi:hypothetical protein
MKKRIAMPYCGGRRKEEKGRGTLLPFIPDQSRNVPSS